jgi:hypothetical protein
LLCEFDIDHAKALVSCSVTSVNVVDAGTVCIDKVIDSFSVEVTTDEDNIGRSFTGILSDFARRCNYQK